MTRKPELSTRQAQVVERVARGLPDKRIAAELGISTHTVQFHIQQAAARIPGSSPARQRVRVLAAKMGLFFLGVLDDE